jgi:ABC-type branched-subunit amino acid transport system ATPase component
VIEAYLGVFEDDAALPEGKRLLPRMSVRENLELGCVLV